ncbi:LmbU family transcriptional regulator [Micromonospora zhanjiangensis]|uniref:LmbU family transcriptional regulator n=1 Tax=Micromonospora zhanjiangensis TaxID=1522057 RepID=A0ABV8KTN2_9ACTN
MQLGRPVPPAGPLRPAETARLSIDGGTLKRRTALFMPQGMPISAWSQLGRQIFVVSDASSWWLGDWLIYGQSQYPDRYKRAIAETSLDYQTLRNYAWVARSFTPDRRRDALSFQHHAEVAGLSQPEQDAWLTRAEHHGWSRNELRRRIRASRQPEGSDRQVINIQMNVIADQKQRWQEAAETEDKELLAWMSSILDGAARRVLEARTTDN